MSNYELNFMKTIEYDNLLWNINIVTQFSSIIIQFYSKNSFYLYESILTLNDLHQKFNNKNLTLKEIFNIISTNLIDSKKFEIEKNIYNVKLILNIFNSIIF